MKTIFTLILALNCMISISQISTDSTTSIELGNKFTHTFYLGQPTNFEATSDPFQISTHYTLGFLTKRKKNREIQIGYRLHTYKPTGGWGNVSFISNSQVFYILYGGRRYFYFSKNDNFNLYFNWHAGISVINFEDGNETLFGMGNTLPIPVISAGLYTQIAERFEIGVTVEGPLPVLSLRLGYRFR